MRFLKKMLAVVAACMVTTASWAQYPQIWRYGNSDKSFLGQMSDNGQWGVTSGTTNNPATAKLINLLTHKITEINKTPDIVTQTQDVTDDGKIVVGSYDGKPAFYDANTGSWNVLPIVGQTTGGIVDAVTPDGKYAVGCCTTEGWYYTSTLWDLKTKKVIETPNLPDVSYQSFDQVQFRGISADGKKLWGHAADFDFVYDVDKATYTLIGFDVADDGLLVSKVKDFVEFSVGYVSNNFKYMCGSAGYYVAGGNADGSEDTYYNYPFVYNVETGELKIYDDDYARGQLCAAVSDEGYPFISSPYANPYREWSLYTGKYWISYESAMKQLYGVQFKSEYEFDNTGTMTQIAGDNKTICVGVNYWGGANYSSYICKLPTTFSEWVKQIKVLGSYKADPEEASEISMVKNVTLTFDRKIVVASTSKSSTAVLEKEDGTPVANSIRFRADGTDLSIAFLNVQLEEGEQYYVHIPANAIQMEGDAEQTNDDIYIDYVGRHQGPVKLVSVNPADGNTLAKLDINTSPITLTFDTNIKMDPNETRRGLVYRGNETEPYTQLAFFYGDKRVIMAPTTAVNLLKDETYRIVLPAGLVTDKAGNGGNEEISFTYKGAYEREIASDNEDIFFTTFDNLDLYNQFMVYDGDKNVPTDVMKNWGFTKNQPWWVARSSTDSKDYAAVSHSMYSPAGQSDDWMVTHQLYIPDENCTLEFLSQSYLKNADDYLKVYVWPCDRVYNSLSQDVVAKIKEEGVLVYNEKQDPGKEEETLEGDWKTNKVDLKQFAGKDVYVAFVNDNKNQSAVFVDNVAVKHNMHILVGMDVESSVVAQEAVEMTGVIAGNNDEKTYQDITLTLKDEDGKTVDVLNLKNQNLKKGVRSKFAFAKKLPLKSGVSNKYSVDVASEGETFSTVGTINNLVFSPEKHVIIEEFTGRDCPNCPFGIIEMERLEKLHGDKVIPMAYHGYTGDPLIGGLSNYCAYMNFSAAPSANINRKGIYYPVVSATLNDKPYYFFSAAAYNQTTGLETEDLWEDVVEKELTTPALSEVTAKMTYNEDENMFEVPFEVKYALNATGQNINIMGVLLEDNIDNLYQQNSLGGVANADFGEWGQGGKYSASYATGYLCQDVARALVGETYNGTSGYIPQTIEAGKVYSGTLSLEVPVSISNIRNCKMAVIMFNANTGEVVNACVAKYSDPTGIKDVISETNPGIVKVYNMQGMLVRKVASKAEAVQGLRGLYIVNGKKMLLK